MKLIKQEPLFSFDPTTGEATCILQDKEGNIIYGIAQCHPHDMDMISEKTGCNYAYSRAYIKVLQKYKKELKIKLSALNQLYYSMNRSKHFNEKSYENKMLQRQIKMLKEDIEYTNILIGDERSILKQTIDEKDKFYKRVRDNRNKDKNK